MERNRTDEMRSMTERYAVRLNAVAKRYGVKVIDLQKVFDKYMEYRPGLSVSWDRVHPGAFGSMLIAREILKEMSVKTYCPRSDGKIVLHPENEAYRDILVEDCKIQGKVVGCIKVY